jgi:predicted AlkP superfamily pyrophosphatase or phosphodiesterase
MYPENHGIIANHFYDPFTNEKFSINDTAQVRNAKWYKGEAIWETAMRQGIITASYFWPGSEVNLEYRRPDYFEIYEHSRPYERRIKGVLDWMSLPGIIRPHFITLYFDAADTYGHKFGPSSKELNNTLIMLDSLVGKLLTGLTELGLRDSTDLIIVSDHGMTEVSAERIINIEKLLPKYSCKFFDNGPFMFIFPKNEEKDLAYNELKNLQKNFRVYKKSELPEYFHFSNNPLIPDILIIADPGWTLISNKDEQWIKSYNSKGDHGYDPNFLDMHGIFLAIGPSFRQGYFTGTINNIDIYPLLAKILNIVPNNNIDGKLERIEFLLK